MLVVARTTKVGPVLVTIAPGHGVHLGDAVSFLTCYLAASVATLRTVR